MALSRVQPNTGDDLTQITLNIMTWSDYRRPISNQAINFDVLRRLIRLVSTFITLLIWRVHYRKHITDSVPAGSGRWRVAVAFTGRARRLRTSTAALGSPRAPCTEALVSSGGSLFASGVGAAERLLQFLHQPGVELFLARGRAGTRWGRGAGGPQRGARRRRSYVRQRTHRGRRPVRAHRRRPRWKRRPLRPRLRNFPHTSAWSHFFCILRGPPRPLRVVNIPVVLHYWHHKRHLGGTDGDSLTVTFLVDA